MTSRRRKALVTGGTRGIGAATAVALRDAGLDVVVTGTMPDGAAPNGCSYLAIDLSDPARAEAFAEEVARGGFSVLVNNAGVNKAGPVEGYARLDLERILDVNLVAPYLLCRAVVPGKTAHNRSSASSTHVTTITCPRQAVCQSASSGVSRRRLGDRLPSLTSIRKFTPRRPMSKSGQPPPTACSGWTLAPASRSAVTISA